jgi:hypothetical protein
MHVVSKESEELGGTEGVGSTLRADGKEMGPTSELWREPTFKLRH